MFSPQMVVRALIALLAVLVVAPAAAEAKKRKVEPGRGTLQRAVEEAKPGDTLVLKRRASYETKGREGVVVEKELTIKGRGDGRNLPTVDGRCRVGFTMLILASPVTLKDFKVTGASDEHGAQYGGAEVNFINGAGGSAKRLSMRDRCGVKYGVNVFDTGDVVVDGGVFKGYDDAGVYVGGVRDPEAVVEVGGVVAKRNNRGIIVEDSRGNGGIFVAGNATSSNGNGFTPSGIFLHNADGVVLAGNVARHNPYAGIHLDATSDRNRVFGNSASGNGAGALAGPGADLVNEGQGNCGSGNAFATRTGNELGAC